MKLPLLFAFCLLPFAFRLPASPLGTAFTYQGRLNDGANPATGIYDLRFAIYDALTGGNTIASPLTNAATGVTNGLFTVTLDFGAGVFDGAARWLDVGVRTNGGGGFAALAPRQALAPAPYAVRAGTAAQADQATTALTAATAALATDLAGPLPAGRLAGAYTAGVELTNPTNDFYGQFYGNAFGQFFGSVYGDLYGDGYGLMTLNAAALVMGTVPDARLSTNVAFLPANQLFTGTNTFAGVLVATNPANQVTGTFTGSGAGLTGLNGASLGAGTVTNAALASSAVTADKVAGGQVVKSLNALKDDVVLSAGANITLNTNGNALQISAATVAAWNLAGNSGASPTNGNFLGTTDNQPLELWVNGMRGLRLEPVSTSYDQGAVNIVGGSPANSIAPGSIGSVIAGGGELRNGYSNSIASDFCFLGGGVDNSIQGVKTVYSVLCGGYNNSIQSDFVNGVQSYSFLGGGIQNSIQGNCQVIFLGGGAQNTITNCIGSFLGAGEDNSIQSAANAFLGGGFWNIIQSNAFCAFLGGGYSNTNGAPYSMVPGGDLNLAGGANSFAAGHRAKANYAGDFVWADSQNVDFNSTTNDQFLIRAQGGVGIGVTNPAATLEVGGINRFGNYSGPNLRITGSGGGGSVVALDLATYPSGANDPAARIQASDDNYSADIDFFTKNPGNSGNTLLPRLRITKDGSVGIGTTSPGSALQVNGTVTATAFAGDGSGLANILRNSSASQTGNLNLTSSATVTLQAATASTASGSGWYTACEAGVAGLSANSSITAFNAGVVGKNTGTAANTAGVVGSYSDAAWGALGYVDAGGKTWGGYFSGNGYFSGGAGIGATNLASGGALTIRAPMGVPPLSINSPDNALVLGQYSTSGYKWIQAYGGALTLNPLGNSVGIGLTNPAHLFQVVNAYCDGNTWSPSSDRNVKAGFAPVDAQAVLAKVAALPVTRWHYTNDAATPHVGPMAQDFYAAFGVGADDKHIADVDEGGVALAAIQGLNQKVEARSQESEVRGQKSEVRIQALEAENAELKARLNALEQRLAQ